MPAKKKTQTKQRTRKPVAKKTDTKAVRRTAPKTAKKAVSATAKKSSRIKKKIVSQPKRSFSFFIAIGLFIILVLHLLFTYHFDFKRTTLRLFEKMGFANQTYDLDGHRIFEVNDITYVAYDHPLVTAKIVTGPECDHEMCDLDALKREILMNLTPAIQFEEVDLNSEEGTRLINEIEAKSIPAFVFDENIKFLGNFEFIEDFFVERGKYYLLKTPPGKFIKTPHNETAHTKGSTEPLVTITEFSSFSCSFCKQSHTILNSLLESYEDVLEVRYIHFNRGGHDNQLIHASECAAEQDSFWKIHDAFFFRQNDLIDKEDVLRLDLVAELADALDLDEESFSECMKDEGRFASQLQGMQKVVADYSIQASPSMFINEVFVEGVLSERELHDILDDMIYEIELEEAGMLDEEIHS